MSTSNHTIEQRIVEAGVECHALVDAFHDQLKTDYLRDEYGLRHPPGLVQTGMARVMRWFPGLQALSRPLINSALIASFGGLHVADGIVTYLGLTFAQVAEINPILNYFAGLLGVGISITVLKLAILFLIAAIYIDRSTIKSLWGTTALAMVVMFYSGVFVSNVLLVAGL